MPPNKIAAAPTTPAPVTVGQNNSSNTHFASNITHEVDQSHSLFAHPNAQTLKALDYTQLPQTLATNMADLLSDCLNIEDSLMVSFHSPRGFIKCKNLHDRNNSPAPLQDPQKPSLIQHCLQAKCNQQEFKITVNKQSFIVKVDKLEFNEGAPEPQSVVRHMKGTLLLTSSENANTQPITIPFIEFAPAFDGRSLKANDLKGCHQLAAEYYLEYGERIETEDPYALPLEKPQKMQFSSAMGICRSASLLIFDQFVQECEKLSAGERFNPNEKVEQLITQAKLKTDNQGLIPFKDQVDELKKLCNTYHQAKLLQCTQAQSAQTSSVEQTPPPVQTTEPPSAAPAETTQEPAESSNTESLDDNDVENTLRSLENLFANRRGTGTAIKAIAEAIREVHQNKETKSLHLRNHITLNDLGPDAVKLANVISKMSQIEELNLTINLIDTLADLKNAADFMKEIAKLPNLKKLNLWESEIFRAPQSPDNQNNEEVSKHHSSILESIGSMKKLETLILGSTFMGSMGEKFEPFLSEVKKLNNLKTLYLDLRPSSHQASNQDKTWPILIAQLGLLKGLTELEKLQLDLPAGNTPMNEGLMKTFAQQIKEIGKSTKSLTLTGEKELLDKINSEIFLGLLELESDKKKLESDKKITLSFQKTTQSQENDS